MKAKYDCDVLFAGNGILALSTAFALQRENPAVRMKVVGPAAKPGSASLASGCLLSSFLNVGRNPERSAPERSKLAMNQRAAKLWPDWLEEINSSLRTHALSMRSGIYVVGYRNAQDESDDGYESLLTALRESAEKFSEIDPGEVPGLSPTTDSGQLRAVYLPNDSSVRAANLTSALEACLVAGPSCELVDELVTRLRVLPNGVKELHTASGKIFRAPHVVITAGARSQELIETVPELTGRTPRLFHASGTGVLVRTENIGFERAIRFCGNTQDPDVQIIPYGKDEAYIGASHPTLSSVEEGPRVSDLSALLGTILERLQKDLSRCEVIRLVVGSHPCSEDRFPLLGQTSVNGVWILAGTRQEGIHLSPLLAKSFAREICGKTSLFENPFLPERTPFGQISGRRHAA